MLSTIIRYGKKILLALIISAMILTTTPSMSFADLPSNPNTKIDVVIRAGEWGNAETVKSGKRYEWGTNINISQHGLQAKDIPTDIPLRQENGSWFISEFDINMKLAKAITRKLEQLGVSVKLQYATSKNQDLNAAGRIADKSNPKIYLSVHHNSYKDDSRGYFFMTNPNDEASSSVAQKLSNSIKDNGKVPQMQNRLNTGYIGEMNTVAKEGRISILGEFGFFNKTELMKIMSDEYVDYISTRIANELYNQLNSMTNDKKAMNTQENKKVIGIKRKDYNKNSRTEEEIKVRFNEQNVVVSKQENVVISFK
jgi:hypothetical protein